MKMIFFIFLLTCSIFANAINIIEDSAKIVKGGKELSEINHISKISQVGKLNKLTYKSLNLSKIENIQNLMTLAVKEKRIGFVKQFQYIEAFKNLKDGDKLLLKCLKNSNCNLDNYSELMTKSPLHVQIANKYPYMNLTQINHKVGSINENIMKKYFRSTGWIQIEGEIGRNGIDGLFIKKKNGMIYDVMVVESKYNKSGLQHTNNGQQMSKDWILKKIHNLQIKYPNNQDYKTIENYIYNDAYRALLWNLKTNNNTLVLSLKKVHDRISKVLISEIVGSEKMKINFNGNQNINIKNPKNNFHKQIVSWYNNEINL